MFSFFPLSYSMRASDWFLGCVCDFIGCFNLVLRVCRLGETLAVAGHVPRPNFSARGGVGGQF